MPPRGDLRSNGRPSGHARGRPRRTTVAARLDDSLAGGVGEVQPRVLVPLLQEIHDAQALPRRIEPPEVGETGAAAAVSPSREDVVEGACPRRTERGLAQVVGEGDGLDQILVERQGAADRPRHLTSSVCVNGFCGGPRRRAGSRDRFLPKPSGRANDDAIAVALMRGAMVEPVRRLDGEPPRRVRRPERVGRRAAVLAVFQRFSRRFGHGPGCYRRIGPRGPWFGRPRRDAHDDLDRYRAVKARASAPWSAPRTSSKSGVTPGGHQQSGLHLVLEVREAASAAPSASTKGWVSH